MTKEEIIKILNLINSVNEEERNVLISKYQERVAAYFNTLRYPERKELIAIYNGILFDMGLIKSVFLSEEERAKRKKAAMNKPKFTEKEAKIREIFISIFNEEPYWLKSKKSFSQFRNKGLAMNLPHWDSNLSVGYLDARPKGYSICLSSGSPYFYIYIGEGEEDIFLYMNKIEETDLKSAELNQKGIEFLTKIQETFATRTPDSIYISSFYDEEEGKVIWMVTSSDFEHLVYSTERITSGLSNIISISEEAFKSSKLIYPVSTLKEEVKTRIASNGNPKTIQMLNELRDLFDASFAKNKQAKRELVSPENTEN